MKKIRVREIPLSIIISELFDTKILGIDENFRIVRNSRLVQRKGGEWERIEVTPRPIDRGRNPAAHNVLLPKRRIKVDFFTCEIVGALILNRYPNRGKNEVWWHKDKNLHNNHPDNLRVMTVSEIHKMEEMRKRMSETHKGKKASLATRVKLSNSAKELWKKRRIARKLEMEKEDE